LILVRFALPGRPRTATSSRTLARLRAIASRTARRRTSSGAAVARSSSARAGVVTGIASSRTISKGTRVRCSAIPGMARGPRIGMVTSMGRRSSISIKRQSAAAEWWLSTAPGPQALTAARQRPRHSKPACPHAKTPRCTSRNCPRRQRRITESRDMPHAHSSALSITPHCRAAIRAARSSGESAVSGLARRFRLTSRACRNALQPNKTRLRQLCDFLNY